MLAIPPSDLAAMLPLCGEGLLLHLESQGSAANAGRRLAWKSEFDTLLQADLERELRGVLRRDDAQREIESLGSSSTDAGLAPLVYIDRLVDRYLRFDGDHLVVREGCRVGWAAMLSRLQPMALAAWRLSEMLHRRELALSDAVRVIGALGPLLLDSGREQLEQAELHVHWWGVTDTATPLLMLAAGDYPSGIADLGEQGNIPAPASSWPSLSPARQAQARVGAFRALFRVLDARLEGTPCDHDQPETARFSPQRRQANTPSMTTHADRPEMGMLRLADAIGRCVHPARSPLLMGKGRTFAAGRDDIQLLRVLARQQWVENCDHRFWAAWLTAIFLCERRSCAHGQRGAMVHVLRFLQTLHWLRQRMVMNEVGLRHFLSWYNSGLRRAGVQADEGRASAALRHSVFPHRKAMAECKAATSSAGSEQSMLEQLRYLADPDPVLGGTAHDLAAWRQRIERTHLCLHFIRKPFNEQQAHSLRWAANRRDVRESARSIEVMLSSDAARQVPFDRLPQFRAHSMARRQARATVATLDLVAFLRGLDVAGDETLHAIEVYAPWLRFLRGEPRIRFGSSLSRRIRPLAGLHLSVHCGEDFSHLVTGMRRVAETVEFCELGTGDRIGHALALGYVPGDWLSRQGEIRIPREEFFDNQVWLWHHAIGLAGRVDGAEAMALRCQDAIARHGSRLYPGVQAGPRDYFRAWTLRRNSPEEFLRGSNDRRPRGRVMRLAPDAAHKNDADFGPASQLFEIYLRPLSVRSTATRETVLIRCRTADQSSAAPDFELRDGENREWVDERDLQFWEALQDHLLTEYDRRGIAIEANPSSNVYVGRIDDYAQHPLFRWFPPRAEFLMQGARFNRYGLRAGHVRVSINTDDPGIFPTDLMEEFRRIREAALLHFRLSTLEVDDWLARLRQYAVHAFHAQHAPILHGIG
ncbi:MAG: hypothetical protein KF778_13945 [Rhodocyclaceae bacterium]|nr:hypothetical protein [Rhodocyclaceae bacterium]